MMSKMIIIPSECLTLFRNWKLSLNILSLSMFKATSTLSYPRSVVLLEIVWTSQNACNMSLHVFFPVTVRVDRADPSQRDPSQRCSSRDGRQVDVCRVVDVLSAG